MSASDEDMAAPAARAASMSGKAPLSAAPASSAAAAAASAASASSAHPVTSGKAPRASGAKNRSRSTGAKAPRAKGKKEGEGGKLKKEKPSKSVKIKKERGSDDEEEEEADASSSSSGDSEDDDDDDRGMTISEEEDLREEESDLEAEGLKQEQGKESGHGAGKTPASHLHVAAQTSKQPAGKQPRGSGPVTSDRVFSMAPRRNDEVAAEEEEKVEAPLDDNLVQLPTPFFDLRSLDLSTWKETGIKLPRARFFKLQHQHIVENFPFFGVVNPALLASSCHYSQPPLLYNSQTMQLVEMNMRVGADEEKGADESEEQTETLASIQSKLQSLNADMEIVEVRPQEDLAALLPPPPPSAEEIAQQAAEQAAAEEKKTAAEEKKEADAARAKEEELKRSQNLYSSKFNTTSSSRRSRGAGKEEGAAAAAAAASSSSSDVIELDTSAGLSSSAAASLSLPLHPSPMQLASLSIEPAYDDEVSAELWLLQRQLLSQTNHNNYVRNYLSTRAHESGDWKVNLAQIEQKEKQDKDVGDLYEESFFLHMARSQRESRRAKFEQSEAGQIRNIKRSHRTHERNQRHIQRLMKSMLIEVERREKKRLVNERRSASAAQRAAKRDRRALLEKQWKTRKEQENYRKCEKSLDSIIKQIEKAVEGKVSINHRKPRDPNKPPRPRKKKEKGTAHAPIASHRAASHRLAPQLALLLRVRCV